MFPFHRPVLNFFRMASTGDRVKEEWNAGKQQVKGMSGRTKAVGLGVLGLVGYYVYMKRNEGKLKTPDEKK